MTELGEIARQLTSYSDFDRRGNIYENIVSSGDVKLIRNKAIVTQLILLEEAMMYMNRMERIHFEAVMTHAVMAAADVVKFSTGEVMKPDVLYGYKFQNLLASMHSITQEKAGVYKAVLLRIEELNGLLSAALSHQN